jgi:SAM-dependent methyltransferase
MILKHPSLLTPLLRLWLQKQTIYWTYRRAGLVLGAKFLDVGSGSGEHVLELRGAGVNALGVDPNIPCDVVDEGSLVVKKAELVDLTEEFDLIAFNHSLEHMKDPVLPLSLAVERLSKRGKILVRIPTVSSDAFETYKEFWCQLDAPRHIFLHSHKSLEICAARASLKIEEIWCDSSEDQFAVSELFKSGESLLGPIGERRFSTREICSSSELAQFKRRTKHANSTLRGDQICVILSKL